MPQTLLNEIQDFCERRKLPVPQTVVNSDDPQVIQLKALLYEAGNELAIRGEWSALTFEATLTTLAQEDQGAIYDLTATGGATAFRKMKDETIWDRTDQLPIWPINPINWQRLKATTAAMPRYRYRLVRQHLLFTPTPPAGHTVAFEWVSKWWIQDGTSGTIKERFTSDNDTFLIERELLKLGLTWRWKKEKGFDYLEEYNDLEDRLKETLAHDVTRDVLYMDGTEPRAVPGVFVPEYNWSPHA